MKHLYAQGTVTMTKQLRTDTQADGRKRKFSFFANALLKDFLPGFLYPAPALWAVACLLTAFLCVDCFSQIQYPFSQIQRPQTPQFEGFTPVPLDQSYTPQQNYNSPQQGNPYGAALRQPNANQIMEQANPHLSRQEYDDLMNEINGSPGYYHPSAANRFNQMSPQMRAQKEMEGVYNEVSFYDYEMSEAEYCASSKYQNDFPNYEKAKNALKQMLEGTKKLSVKDAYFLAESAYGSLQLSYEEYNNTIKENAKFIIQWLVENGYC